MAFDDAVLEAVQKHRIVAFMDLDDTIFQTRRKCGADGIYTAAVTRDGQPGSFFTSGQRALVELLMENAAVIPVTARNIDGISRVQVPFQLGAIANFGGVIVLPGGNLDERWHNRMAELCGQAAPMLDFILKTANAIISKHSFNCRARIIGDAGLNFYVVIKNYNKKLEELSAIQSELKAALCNYTVKIHCNDNNLSILPDFLNKAAAVSYFVEKYITPAIESPLIFGLGDSLSDLDFLRQCDYMIIPSASQLARAVDTGDKQA